MASTVITEDISVCGQSCCGRLEESSVPELAKRFKSWMYLAKDTPDDIQIIPEGFRSLASFPDLVKIQVPIDLNNTSMAAVETALAALTALPKPTLITCGHTGRAAALAVIYLARANKWTTGEALSFARQHGLHLMLDNPKLVDLVTRAIAS